MTHYNAISTTLGASMDASQQTLQLAATLDALTGVTPVFPINAHIEAEGANADEIVQITGLSSGTTYTCVRASERYAGSATPSAHGLGATVRLVVTASGLALPLTTKGDILGYDTAADRVPIGSDGQVLTADSTQALGLKWAAGGGGGRSPSRMLQDVDFTALDGLRCPDLVGSNDCFIMKNGGTYTADANGVTTDGSASAIDAGTAILGRFTFTVAVKFKTTTTFTNGMYWQNGAIYSPAYSGAGNDFGCVIGIGGAGKVGGWESFSPGGDQSGGGSALFNDGYWHTAIIRSNGTMYEILVDGVSQWLYTYGSGTVLPAGAWNGPASIGLNPWLGRTNALNFSATVYGAIIATFNRLRTFGKCLNNTDVADVWSLT